MKKLLIALFFLILISIPITLSLVQTPQETRTRASGGTKLYLVFPPSTTEDSAQKGVSETFDLDLMADPGSANVVTGIKFQVKFDPTKLQPASESAFTPAIPPTPNDPTFTVIQGPIVNATNGTISEVLTTGLDTTKAIRKVTKVGTFKFKAIGTTPEDTPTVISFNGSLTQAFSAGTGDQAAENVLSLASPAEVEIGGVSNGPPAGGTALTFKNLLLHGIGSAGDNPNPTDNDLSNKNPKHPQRNIKVFVYDSDDEEVANGTGTVTYNSEEGFFEGFATVANLTTGSYTVKVKSDRYLRRLYPGVISLVANQENILPQIELIAGDTNGDNTLDILDYNALLDCGYGEFLPLPITNSNADYNSAACETHENRINIDLDDNGFVNSSDYNLFLRELSVQNGD